MRTPGWRRAVLLRRGAAVVLLSAAVLTTVHRGDADDTRLAVTVRDIPAGATVGEDDLSLVPVPEHLRPAGAVTDPVPVAGQVAATALPAGSIPTSGSFVGQRLVDELLAGSPEPGNLVPLKLAEPEVIALLRHGDTVTVVSHRPESPEPVVIAEHARVVLAESTEEAATVLVALPETAARQVAAAALTTPLAVVLTGPR